MTDTMKITQTSQRGLEPTSSKLAGQFEHLRALLKQRLGPDHAFLFAEPVQLGASRETAWFVDAIGNARRAVDLPPDLLKAAKTRALELVNDIRALAEQLSKQGDAGRDLARILVDSLVVPSADRLWVVDGRPVMVDWGWREATDVATPTQVLTLIGSEPDPTPRAPHPASPEAKVRPTALTAPPLQSHRLTRGRDLLTPALWAVFVALLLIVGNLLLKACAIGGANWPDFLRPLLPDSCPVTSSSANLGVVAAEQGMRAAEMDLLRAQARCRLECPVPAVIPQTPVTPPVRGDLAPSRDAMENRVDRADLARGRLDVTLGWAGSSDLDLSVVCPDGSTIDYSMPINCGGALDYDRNSSEQTVSSTPFEHIRWVEEPFLRGAYKVIVKLYSLRLGATLPVPYRVLVKRGEQILQEETGILNEVGRSDMPLTFQVPTVP